MRPRPPLREMSMGRLLDLALDGTGRIAVDSGWKLTPQIDGVGPTGILCRAEGDTRMTRRCAAALALVLIQACSVLGAEPEGDRRVIEGTGRQTYTVLGNPRIGGPGP